ncbi:unnamed protein product [Symbiodinium microadriaticum]|nr:unnamed protein product [Symbiodinium microadriaticum]CAE7271636.1 unnamed protein product [Symbiodinium sp. KB8]
MWAKFFWQGSVHVPSCRSSYPPRRVGPQQDKAGRARSDRTELPSTRPAVEPRTRSPPDSFHSLGRESRKHSRTPLRAKVWSDEQGREVWRNCLAAEYPVCEAMAQASVAHHTGSAGDGPVEPRTRHGGCWLISQAAASTAQLDNASALEITVEEEICKNIAADARTNGPTVNGALAEHSWAAFAARETPWRCREATLRGAPEYGERRRKKKVYHSQWMASSPKHAGEFWVCLSIEVEQVGCRGLVKGLCIVAL